jgi:3-hexulose-6-phosphate synthase/6-phospho-3-hexuloisomerase
VEVVADMYSVRRTELAERAQELERLGVNYIMIHLGVDESRDEPEKHPLDGLEEVLSAVSVPVGVGTFSAEDAVEAVRKGAFFVVQGEPLVSANDSLEKLRSFIRAVKNAT